MLYINESLFRKLIHSDHAGEALSLGTAGQGTYPPQFSYPLHIPNVCAYARNYCDIPTFKPLAPLLAVSGCSVVKLVGSTLTITIVHELESLDELDGRDGRG